MGAEGISVNGLSGGVGLTNRDGPCHNKGAGGLEDNGSKGWFGYKGKTQRVEPRRGWSDRCIPDQGQGQLVELNKYQTDGRSMVLEEISNGLNWTEDNSKLKHALDGWEAIRISTGANYLSKGAIGGSSSMTEQVETGAATTIIAAGQSKERVTGSTKEVINSEGFDLALVPLECNQIEPLATVEPRSEGSRQFDDEEWFLERGDVSESSEWAKRKLKGFGKFLGISYEGMEDEAVRLFARIEQRWKVRGCYREGRSRQVSKSKGMRELKNLEWSVADGRKEGRGRSWSRGLKEDRWSGSHLETVSNED